MRLAHALVTRPDWYDRNPLAVIKAYNAAGVAPHAPTSRWTYTVPAARKFMVQQCETLIQRYAVAAAADLSYANIFYTPSGGAQLNYLVAYNMSNTVGAGTTATGSGTTTLLPGDALAGFTSDGSTTGSQIFTTSIQGVEFDA